MRVSRKLKRVSDSTISFIRSYWKLLILIILFITSIFIFIHFKDCSKEKVQFFYQEKPNYKKNSNFTINPHSKCKDENLILVILVATRPKETDARQAIRSTWGTDKMWFGKKVITLFLLGKDVESHSDIEKESLQYGDIIGQDFIDSYDNLTLKTIMAFQWISEFCPKADYVMKADADVFINVKYLVNFLLKISKSVSSDFFTGYPLINTKPSRLLVSKAYISKNDYPFCTYPPYCSGFAYVFSGELGLKIYTMMSHVKPITIEDVYVGICLKLLGVNLQFSVKEFFLHKLKFNTSLFSRLIAVHDFTPPELIRHWNLLKELNETTY